jgi:hypothetical protein
LTGPMRSLARADEIGRPWSLETEQGRWAVRLLDKCFDIDNVETEVRLQEAASEAGVLLAASVRSTSGAIVESIDGDSLPQAMLGGYHSEAGALPPLDMTMFSNSTAAFDTCWRMHRRALISNASSTQPWWRVAR